MTSEMAYALPSVPASTCTTLMKHLLLLDSHYQTLLTGCKLKFTAYSTTTSLKACSFLYSIRLQPGLEIARSKVMQVGHNIFPAWWEKMATKNGHRYHPVTDITSLSPKWRQRDPMFKIGVYISLYYCWRVNMETRCRCPKLKDRMKPPSCCGANLTGYVQIFKEDDSQTKLGTVSRKLACSE